MYHFFPVATGDKPHFGDLAKHYQTLADQLQLPKPAQDVDSEITELIIVTADMEAQWLEKTMALIERLYPQAGSAVARTLCISLQAQVQRAKEMALVYRAKLARHWHAHPQCARPKGSGVVDDLTAFSHYTYPLGQLLQILPGDITNQPRLTQDEIDMCKSVAALAYQAQETLLDGLEALGQLQAMAEAYCPERPLPAIGKLIAWLTEQSRFMGLTGMEYRAAADNIRRR